MTFSKKNQKPSSLKLVISSIIIASIAGVAYFSYIKKNEKNDGEKKEATAETVNEIKSTGLDPDKDVSDVRTKISFSRNKERDKFYMMDTHQYIDFFLRYDIDRIEYNNTPVRISEKMFDDFGEGIFHAFHIGFVDVL
jgi:hypothetical protein